MINYNRQKRKPKPTRKQVGHALDIFAPSPQITATVKQIKLVQRGNLRAYADVELSLNGWVLFVLRGVRVVQQKGQKAWVQMPHQRSDVDGIWYPIVKNTAPDVMKALKGPVLAAYVDKTKLVQVALIGGDGS